MPEPTQKCKLNTILMQNCALKLLIVLNIAFLLDYCFAWDEISVSLEFYFEIRWIGYYFAPGEMAEWSIATVLKTVDCYRSGGSNPSLSAQ